VTANAWFALTSATDRIAAMAEAIIIDVFLYIIPQ